MDDDEVKKMLSRVEALRRKHAELAAEHEALMRQMEELLARRKIIKEKIDAELRDPSESDR